MGANTTPLKAPLLPAPGTTSDSTDRAALKASNAASPAWPNLLASGADKIAVGWQATLAWSGFIVVWYSLLQKLVRSFMRAGAVAELFAVVGPRWYTFSESAFATATTLNLLNLVFEETPDKQQLALLSAVIKGLSWHSDHLITSGLAVVKRDIHGALFVPSRYVQWSCSTPTMIFTLSRISTLTPLETATTMAADWLMVAMGWASCELSWPWAFIPLALSFVCFAYVMRMLWRILHDAMREAGSPHARNCLMFTLGSTLVVWSLFPVAWLAGHMTFLPAVAAWGEPLTIFCNFAAKVVFSTSIMFNNFVTLAQRRRAARKAAEHEERLQAVQELSVAVSRKDAFLAVVGHELRTPLNAICQLASALTLGAAGPVTAQARDWLSTIKASASHLLGVVNDIIMFRANQAGLVIKQEVVPLGEVVDEVLRTLLPSAGSTVTLEKVVHARLPPVVGDRRRLVLSLTNLVANSIKFMDKPNGRVTVKAYPDRGARHVMIKVVDNGPGLSAQQLAQINDAAHTAQIDAFSRRAGGLGLGLPITFQLAAAHGGVVRVTSPGVGQGTTALLKLPVLQPATDARLKNDFTAAYQGVGYSMEQLLSSELALSEGRLPLAFVALPPSPALPAALAEEQPAAPLLHPSPSMASSVTGTSVSSSQGLVPLQQQRGSGSGNAAAQQQQQQRASFGSSTGSSFDLSQAMNIRATYMWPVPTVGGAGAGGAAAAAAAGGPPGSNRGSHGSLAAWEAYAEHMGYTLPAGGAEGQAAGAAGAGGAAAAAPTIASAAAAPRGVPGQATALMSTLYMPMTAGAAVEGTAHGAHLQAHQQQQLRQLQQQQQRVSGGAYKPGSTRAMLMKGSTTSSTRISIEEGDEEGQESEERPAVHSSSSNAFAGKPPMPFAGSIPGSLRDSIDVGTPTKQVYAGGRTSDDVARSYGSAGNMQQQLASMQSGPAGQGAPGGEQDRTTQHLLESAALATAAMQQQHVMMSTASTSSTFGNGSKPPSQQPLPQPAPPAPPPPAAPPATLDVSEWETYLMSGGDPLAPVCREDAEAVVAANARLSIQYNKAVQEAQAKGLPLDPTWYAWVARIPEHHKASDRLQQMAAGGAGGQPQGKVAGGK